MIENREPTAEERQVAAKFQEFMQAISACAEAGGDANAAMVAAIPPEMRLQIANEMPLLAAFLL